MNTKTLYDTFVDKFGKNKDTINLLGFYLTIEKFGLEHLSGIYTEDEIVENFEKINSLDLFSHKNDINVVSNDIQFCNIEWFRYFVKYSETHNSIEASNNLNITTQGLNKAILGLEKHYKTNLVERNKVAKGLTISGQVFVDKAKKVLELLSDIDKYFKDIKSQEIEGVISVGTFNIGDLFCLDESILEFTQKYNNIYIKIDLLDSQKLEDSIFIGDIDIGLTTVKPINSNIEYLKVAETKYVIVGKPESKKNWDQFKYLISKQSYSSKPPIWSKEFKRDIVGEISTRSLLMKLCK
ncbi:MAG: hypothetical protein ACK4IX_03760, partial [Candidatus Sericytochromatia bacterium]